MSESLYFIAILPPKKIQEEITSFKQIIADRFESTHAFNAPPHITLHMPFRLKKKKEDKLLHCIDDIRNQMSSLSIQLDGFDFFEPRVVFVNVIPSEKLNNLQGKVVELVKKKLKIYNANYKERPFHPHITIGFRDLKKSSKGTTNQVRHLYWESLR